MSLVDNSQCEASWCAGIGKSYIEHVKFKNSDKKAETAGKVILIALSIFAALLLAIPTLGLSIIFPAWCLYKGSKIKQNPIVNSINDVYQKDIAGLPPVGLENTCNNCYLNTALQLIMNMGPLREAFERMALEQERLGEYPVYKDLIEDYRNCQTNGKKMQTGEGTPYHRFYQYAVKNDGRMMIGQQSDVNIPIEFFLNELRKYSVSVLSEEQNNALMFTHYAGDPDIDIGMGIEEQGNQYSEPPPFILLCLNHLKDDKHDLLGFKLSNDVFINKDHAAEYSCRYFSIHIGSNSMGHYYGCIKIDNQWYQINDEAIDPITHEEVRRITQENSIQSAYYEIKA